MPTYDNQFFNPPAPMAYVTLRNDSNSKEVQGIPFLLDTGASATLIPLEAIRMLDVDVSGSAFELLGFDGQSSEAPMVLLTMMFENLTFQGEFLTIDREYGIIGRNILNNLRLLLNGPEARWERHLL